MFLAVAVETSKHPRHQNSYKVWYLELDRHNNVIGIGVKTKEELIQSLFEGYRTSGKSQWRAFPKEASASIPVEAVDFISRNANENTHFGNLPTLVEFQGTLKQLELNLELRSLAS